MSDRLIGNLLDRWEMTPNDLKEEMREHGCGKQLDELLREIEKRERSEYLVSVIEERERLRRALELLVRCGQKQGWQDAYEQEMQIAYAALETRS